MPRKYVRKPGSRRYADYSSEKLAEYLSAIKNGTMSTRAAEVHFGIPRRTIINKLKGHIDMSDFGFPVDEFELRCIFHAYLGRIGRVVKQFVNNIPGKEWLRSFLKRIPELSVRFAANIRKSRASITAETLTAYIDNLKETSEGVPPENIWYYDVSNLTDDPGSERVITKRGVKYPENIRNASNASMSIMVCGSTVGEVLPA